MRGGGVLARSPRAGDPWFLSCALAVARLLHPKGREYKIWSQTFCVFLSDSFCCPRLSSFICKMGSRGQFSSVAQSCPTLCEHMNRSTPGLPVHHQLPEFTQTHVHRVCDAIQPSHPLSSPSPPAPGPSGQVVSV